MHIALQEDYHAQFEHFKHEHGILFVLAFSGGADDNHPVLRYIQDNGTEDCKTLASQANDVLIQQIVSDTLNPLPRSHIAILTGGTKWGVPRIAAQTAKELGFKTVGVAPLRAHEKGYTLDESVLDLLVVVPPIIGESRWGDEASVYIKMLDAVIVIGGRSGTLVEVAHLLKRNEDKKAPTKYIVPISGTGGTADVIPHFPGKPETMQKCLPSRLITNGEEAARFLKEELFFDDLYD